MGHCGDELSRLVAGAGGMIHECGYRHFSNVKCLREELWGKQSEALTTSLFLLQPSIADFGTMAETLFHVLW